MKKRLIVFLIIILTFTSSVYAQDGKNLEFRETTIQEVARDQVIESDYVAAGEVVDISGTVMGDVYIAGGNIIINGKVNGDVIAAGGNITILGEVGQNIRAAGGNIIISGNIGRNVSVAGGLVHVNQSADIKGNVLLAGGKILISAPIKGDIKIAGGDVTLSNDIGGNVEVITETLSLSPNAHIQGNLTTVSNKDILINEGANIEGEIIKKPLPKGSPEVNKEELRVATKNTFFVLKFIDYIYLLILGLIFIHFFPVFSRKVVYKLQESPFKSFGVGFVGVALLPCVVLVFFMTIIGIPLAFITIFLLSIAGYFARIFVAMLIGITLTTKFHKKWNDGWSFVVGLTVLFITALIPLISFIVNICAVIIGLGAFVSASKDVYLESRKKNIL